MKNQRLADRLYGYLVISSISLVLVGCGSSKNALPMVLDLYATDPLYKEKRYFVEKSHQNEEALSLSLKALRKKVAHQDTIIEHQKTVITQLKHQVSHHTQLVAKQNSKKIILSASNRTNEEIRQSDVNVQWQLCMEALKKQSYATAFARLKAFNQRYPESPHHSSSDYLLGQLAILQGNLDQAIEFLEHFIQKYPKDDRIPDVKLHMGLAYYAKQCNQKADQIFEEIEMQYPDSRAAHEANKQRKILSDKKIGDQ